ncbi:B12-binding domain-containing radical SAM protein [Desulfoluna spongiiphila]|uniref:B12-binding domain-containing radical SAM protein n=1 Tax=Desulfoluna spongiiphila TaxID=419481 RepID=UPI0012575287|nr:radical SAM protein [Desulfoluna spongiiphila]VVS94679.1 methyltransferase class b [Desulfoluna spongiiphila]
MRIILIAPPLMDYHEGLLTPIAMDAVKSCPPYGIYLLATILRRHGHEVIIIDLIAQGSNELSHHAGLIMSSHLVGIGTTSLAWPTARTCIDQVRRFHPRVPIVLGGIHATLFDTYLLATTSADYCIRGEGDVAFPRLCDTLERGGDLSQVSNLTVKGGDGKIHRTRTAPLLSEAEMASLPMPDYGCIHPGIYPSLGIESSRGCPFDCIFCSTAHRKTWRGLPAEEFVRRVEIMMGFLHLTTQGIIQIIDDEFSVKKERAIEIFRGFREKGLQVQAIFSSRANDMLDATFVESALPFAHQFLVGAECGYNEGLKKAGKGTTTENITRAAALLNEYGIAGRADFSFIIGLPWETRDEVMQTIDFAAGLQETYGIRILIQWYCQIPGSRLWDEQRRKEVLHEALYDDFGFFGSNYLFRSGVALAPSEVHEVTRHLQAIQAQAPPDMVQSCTPEPILKYYPDMAHNPEASGLSNLRDTSGAT